jgi:hypothetical protein
MNDNVAIIKPVPLPGYRYEVSTKGHVYRNGIRLLKHQINENGLHLVSLSKRGRAATFSVPYLMLITFRGLPPDHEHQTPGFINGDKDDLRIQNLEWRTWWYHIGKSFREREEKTYDATSMYNGVCETRNGKWQAYITVRGVEYNLGLHLTEEEAYQARLRWETENADLLMND